MTKIVTLTLLILSIVSCVPKPTPLVFDSKNVGNSLEAFKSTVYPIVVKNCAGCHGSNISPYFANSDPNEAHDAILQSYKVNLESPKNSRIYQRLAVDAHNCWGDCNSNSQEMLKAINDWKASRSSSTKPGIRTGAISFSETLKSIVNLKDHTFFEAENSTLSGRFTSEPMGGASGLKIVTSPKVAEHPNRNNSRYGYMNSQCNPNQPTSNATSPYKVENKINHFPDANGYAPYYLKMSFNLIRPDKRDQYLTLLKSKNELDRHEYYDWLWGAQGFVAGDYDGPMYYLHHGSSTMVLPNSPSIFPDGLTLEEFNQKLEDNDLSPDYFAPRFNGLPYSLSGYELKKVLTNIENRNPGWIKKAMWPPMAKRFKGMFFNGEVEWPAPLESAHHFSQGRTGEAGLNNIFPLKYEDAANLIDPIDNPHLREIDKYFYITLTAVPVYRNKVTNIELETRVDLPAGNSQSTSSILKDYYSLAASKVVKYNPFSTTSTNASTYLDQSYDLSNISYPNKAIEDSIEATTRNKYQETIYPVLTSADNKCISCHAGQVSNAPAIASSNFGNAYKAIKEIKGFDLDKPSDSLLLLQMRSFHSNTNNCGTNTKCNSLASVFENSIRMIKNAVDPLVEQSSASKFTKSFTLQEQTPGKLEVKFKVTKTDNYRFYARVRHLGPNIRDHATKYHIDYELINEATNTPVPLTKVIGAGETTLNFTCNESNIRGTLSTLPSNWEWIGSGANQYYKLSPGSYKFRIFEGREGLEIDQYGFKTDTLADLTDMTTASQNEITTFDFDISSQTGISGARFKLDVDSYYGYYKFTNPRIESTSPVWVKGIHLVVNNILDPLDTTFNHVTKKVLANDNSSLSSNTLLVLKQEGPIRDKIAIQFDELRKATSSDQVTTPTGPDNSGLVACGDINYFKKNIAPIFSDLAIASNPASNIYRFYERYASYFKTTNKNGYTDNLLTSRKIFDMGGGAKDANRCIHCHANNVPKFEMSSDPVELCASVLTRINFEDPNNSIIFRGIDGTFNHHHVLFSEVPSIDSNQQWPNSNDGWNGKKSSWAAGDVFYTYENYNSLFNPEKTSTCSPSNITNSEDIKYLRKFIGTYKRYQFVLNTESLEESTRNTPYTNYDWASKIAGRPLETTGWYYSGAGKDLPFAQRQNKTIPFYPADYICGYDSSVPLAQRLQPGMQSECYSPDGSTRLNECRTLKTPDGNSAQYGSTVAGGGYEKARKIFPFYTTILPEYKEGGEYLTIPDTGRENVRNLILKWIQHEKSLRPTSP